MKSLIQNLRREKVLLILHWCESQFGRSQYYRKFPRLRVYKSTGNSSFDGCEGTLMGTYATGLISVYLGSHSSIRQLCGTVIHEYRHYLLSIREYRSLSRDLEDQGLNIDMISIEHPHERDSREFENLWIDICFNTLRKDLYRKD